MELINRKELPWNVIMVKTEVNHMSNEIYIIGAGTYGEVIAELAIDLGYNILGFYDEDESKHYTFIDGIEVLGSFKNLDVQDISARQFAVAIGNNSIRVNIMSFINEVGGVTPTLIHPKAQISRSAVVGNGVYIQANAYIWTKVVIEDYCIISPGVVIAHHTNIGQGCLISTLSAIGANIEIGKRVFVGMATTIITGVSVVGADSVIGAGTVVIKNVKSNIKLVGVPAKEIKWCK